MKLKTFCFLGILLVFQSSQTIAQVKPMSASKAPTTSNPNTAVQVSDSSAQSSWESLSLPYDPNEAKMYASFFATQQLVYSTVFHSLFDSLTEPILQVDRPLAQDEDVIVGNRWTGQPFAFESYELLTDRVILAPVGDPSGTRSVRLQFAVGYMGWGQPLPVSVFTLTRESTAGEVRTLFVPVASADAAMEVYELRRALDQNTFVLLICSGPPDALYEACIRDADERLINDSRAADRAWDTCFTRTLVFGGGASIITCGGAIITGGNPAAVIGCIVSILGTAGAFQLCLDNYNNSMEEATDRHSAAQRSCCRQLCIRTSGCDPGDYP